MDEHDIREIRVPITGGELVTIRVREKGRLTEEGVEGIVFALLHPNTLIEVGEYWVPLSAIPNLVVPDPTCK
jgi:hypothetical protein